MMANPIVVAMPCRKVVTSPERPSAAYDKKKIGYTAVTTIVIMAELAPVVHGPGALLFGPET